MRSGHCKHCASRASRVEKQAHLRVNMFALVARRTGSGNIKTRCSSVHHTNHVVPVRVLPCYTPLASPLPLQNIGPSTRGVLKVRSLCYNTRDEIYHEVASWSQYLLCWDCGHYSGCEFSTKKDRKKFSTVPPTGKSAETVELWFFCRLERQRELA